MNVFKITCIMCPMGCPLDIVQDNEAITVSGNTCKRGEIYGKQEIISPKRMVTSLAKVKGGGVVSVKTNDVIDKARMFEVLEALRGVEVIKPVYIGDIILSDVCGTKVDIVATSERI